MKEELKDKKIIVLMGGVSGEREVSLNSGQAVYETLKEEGYRVYPVDADGGVSGKLCAMDVDAVFLALHGGWGEDGSIQGMLDVAGIPYTGSGVLSSALAMDKVVSKYLFERHGLTVSPYVVVKNSPGGLQGAAGQVPWPLPWIIKPGREGSSLGVTLIKSERELEAALAMAFQYGDTVLVEQFIKGREVQAAVLSGKYLGAVELRTTREFYDYDAKYAGGLTQYILPPDLEESAAQELERASLIACQALSCEGAARVDCIYGQDGKMYVLEVNTLPGMTKTSLLPKIALLAGYSFLALLEEMLLDALRRKEKKETAVSFEERTS